MKYVKLDNVLNYIPSSLRDIDSDVLQWKSWAYQAVRTVMTPELSEHDFCLLHVTGHKAKLPKELKRITSIKVLERKPNDSQMQSLASCVKYDNYKDDKESSTNCDVSVEVTELPDGSKKSIHYSNGCMIAHQLFLKSKYYSECYGPMRYVGRTGSEYFTSECYREVSSKGNCYTDFSISGDGCIQTSVPEALVCIEYTRSPRNEEGDYLLPDDPVQLWQGMAHYAIAQHWLNRTGYNEPNARQMYNDHLNYARNYLREARGIFRMRNIRFELHQEINEGLIKFIKLPAVFNLQSNGAIR